MSFKMYSDDSKMTLEMLEQYRARKHTLSTQVLDSIPGCSIGSKDHSATIWRELCLQFEDKRRRIEAYKKIKHKDSDLYVNPEVNYLDKTVFPTLNDGLVKMLEKAIEEDSLKYPKTTFNGLDYLSEYLWNMNPNYPERRESWTYIFDTEFAKRVLKDKPRPYFPFSRVWSRDFAALKIQSYMRGYWVRRRDDVQEVRQFWKVFNQKTTSSSTTNYKRNYD